MLRKFYVHNFKSLLNFTLEPKGINLLIGLNNAGKTNVCQAMELLAATSMLRVHDALAVASHGATDITSKYFNDTALDLACTCELLVAGTPYVFEYALRVDVPKSPTPLAKAAVASEMLRVTGGIFARTDLLVNDSQQVQVLNETAWRNGERQDSAVWLRMPATPGSTAVKALSETGLCPLVTAFRDYLASWRTYHLENSALRKCETEQPESLLSPEGANLAYVIRELKTGDDRAYREVLEMERPLDQQVEAINFQPTFNQTKYVWMVLEHHDGQRFSVGNLSDGTLRMLALAYIVASARSNVRRYGTVPGVTVVEEPETGIFVGHLKTLFEALDSTGQCGQYFFTSHQPYFIDLFDGHLDSVFLLVREPTHSVLVNPDPDRTRKLLAESFSLGELHFREMLRG